MATSRIMVRETRKKEKENRKMSDNPVNLKTSEASEESAPNPELYVGNSGSLTREVSKKVENPQNGKDIEMTATYTVPLAVDFTDIQRVCPDPKEATFWFNFGRYIAASRQATQSLQFNLGDKKLMDLFNAFSNARKSMLEKNATEKDISDLNKLILMQPKFKALGELLNTWTPEAKEFDFSKIELKMTSGKPGRKASAKAETEAETEVEAE